MGLWIGTHSFRRALNCAQDSGVLRRLELTVQVRNQRAVRLYSSLGFEIEATQKRGAYLTEGEFLDVYSMSKLID